MNEQRNKMNNENEIQELTAKEEDIMLEQALEVWREQKESRQRQQDNAEHICKRCSICRVATDFNCDEWIEFEHGLWVCGECYNELREESC